eukprot:4061768-Alexandrium_andersonii.AAC.1
MPPAPQHPAWREAPPPVWLASGLLALARWWPGSLFCLPARQPGVAQSLALPQLWPLAAVVACLLVRPPVHSARGDLMQRRSRERAHFQTKSAGTCAIAL